MKIMLTSFGIDRSEIDAAPYSMPMMRAGFEVDRATYDREFFAYFAHYGARGYQPFKRMPPLDMRSIVNGFAPEYSLLILCDKLIFDASSFEYLTEEEDQPQFESVGRTLALLKREGFLELRDYRAILAENSSLLESMIQNDLRSTDQWYDAMHSSFEIWTSFLYGSDLAFRLWPSAPNARDMRSPSGIWRSFIHELSSQFKLGPRDRSPHIYYQDVLRSDTLTSYLSYVNSNLILSNEMEAGLHDWQDFQPFYHQKFLAVGRRARLPDLAKASHQLFDIAFPEFVVRSPEHFMSLLTHRRVGELRSLIEEASRGDVEFDEDFARSVFREVIGVERALGKRRRLLGYLTFPIGFLPVVGSYAQFLAEQGAASLMEKRLRKKFRWFYLLSDLADKESRRNT
jgi:hypothetical protein